MAVIQFALVLHDNDHRIVMAMRISGSNENNSASAQIYLDFICMQCNPSFFIRPGRQETHCASNVMW